MANAGVDATAAFESPVIALTKLVPPRLRIETVERPELVARRLESPARLGVITGPAGAGKSTLLAQCHAVDPLAAWLSLDPADDHPTALWWSIIEALRTVVADFGDGYRARLIAGGEAAVDDVVIAIGNELTERAIAIHLFLDDAHLLDDEVARRLLHRFVWALPDGIRVTVASRHSMPLPLARLRASGDLVEIGASELALSNQEAGQLLASFDTTVDQQHLELLVDRTEGWPAGLQLAGLAIAQTADANSFVEGFRGTDRSVADYLVSEVLESVSDDDRNFLIETSILTRLSGELCDAVTGRQGSADTLSRLAYANAFVTPLDREGHWYRYHHLFQDLVAAERRRTRLDGERDLHRRAFDWLRNDGQIAEAIPHALAAGDTDVAVDVFCSYWLFMMSTGRNAAARRLLEDFPPELLAQHQPLAIAAGSLHVMTGDHAGALRWLAEAERARFDGPRPDGMANTRSSVALLRGAIAPHGVDAALADGRTAVELEPPDSIWRGLALLIVGRSLVMQGDDGHEARPYFEEIERRGARNPRAYALAELSLSQLRSGDPDGALETADIARTSLSDAGASDVFIAAIAEAAAALAAIALGDERTARVALRSADRPMKAIGQAMQLDSTRTRLLLAEAAIELHEAEIAREHLRDAKAVIDSIDDVGIMGQQHAALAARLDDLSPGPGNGEVEFTQRELEVIALLPTPLNVREIADELFLSWNTIRTYVRRVYRKLNASSREEAVLVACELGLLADTSTRPSP
ncbi:MAG: LuxR C-terminal-related transcriptional regulator [Acidimicrobiales bacterium]